MSINRIFLVFFFVLASHAQADWAEPTSPLLVRVQPAAGSQAGQNPPGFSWVRFPGATSYVLELSGPNGELRTWSPLRNWLLPETRLPPGNYSWRVRAKNGSAPWSNVRAFTIGSEAGIFEVPGNDELLKRIRQRGRPRSLPYGPEGIANWTSRTRLENTLNIQRLEQGVLKYAKEPLVDMARVKLVPKLESESAWVASLATIRYRTQAESRHIRSAALLWHLTGNAVYLDEAIRRGDAMAALDPNGSTSQLNQDQGNRSIAWGLAVAYDLLHQKLNPSQRANWLAAIRSRTTAIYLDLNSGNWRLEQTPLDSHGGTNIGYLAGLSALMIDHVPEAESWFRTAFRSYVHFQSPWGDEGGGYGNGTAYAEYSGYAFADFWDAIVATTGVNLYQKPWSQGLLKFLACFVPPGSPTHAFGDAAESKPSFETIKAYANRFDSNLARWYSQHLVGNEDPLTALTNPIEKHGATGVAGPLENSCLFKHIGWVAMHSNWAERGRTSVYFKSSPYGSFNHSHADQNSFTVTAAGQPLLIDSGNYGWYGSDHWKNWYRQTVAHNSITFDGGKGQVAEGHEATLKAQGRVTRFEAGTNIDFVEGDATKAYGDSLTKAIRKLWYIRDENSILVVDDLASETPRKFEWNAHTFSDFVQISPTTFKTESGDQSACIDVLSPQGLIPVTTKVPKPATANASASKQTSHLSLRLPVAATTTRFIKVVRIGCQAPISTLSGTKITIGNTTVESLK